MTVPDTPGEAVVPEVVIPAEEAGCRSASFAFSGTRFVSRVPAVEVAEPVAPSRKRSRWAYRRAPAGKAA